MTNITRSAEYRTLALPIFMVRLISVWLKMCVIVSDARKRLSVHDDPQPTGCGSFCTSPIIFRRNTV